MRRSLTALSIRALVLVCLASASAALAASFYRGPGGTAASDVIDSLRPPSVGYARLTASDNDAAIATYACATVKVRLKCNIADAADFDCSATVKDCPSGITDAANAQCSAILDPLTGAPGADAIYGVQAQSVAVKDATIGASQTAQLEVSCY